MKVRLISHTTSCIPEAKTLEELVVYCARVSNPKNQENMETAEKLLKYLLREKHFSPFEMVNICLEINTTRDIAHQIVRHRSFAFQEWSQRYADPTNFLGFETKEARLQDVKNRQNSLENFDEELDKWWREAQMDIWDLAISRYSYALEKGLAKEVARSILPEGNTKSRLYMNGTLRSWIHYLQVRRDPSTQKEHREIAHMCTDVIATVFPIIKEIV